MEKHAESAALFSSFKDHSFHFQLCIQWSDRCDYSNNAEFTRLFTAKIKAFLYEIIREVHSDGCCYCSQSFFFFL